ncbi:Carboxylic ester hydrolase [Mycena sanguinolenta]|uniref:Carboxylic ester hydrolase n=1 Tax=Mycena sanguinolenta TaxID=230812 RepID=A0A8H7D0U8_9AGAR|nr:Carboxylic ester hydrolase [Mycena sanguinolenta]
MSLLNFGLFALLLQTRAAVGATVTERAAAPTVTLDSGTFVGTASSSNTQSFLGIPFAKPPVGDLRFRLPVANDPYNGTLTVNAFGPGCPQQAIVLPVLTGLSEEVVDYVTNSIFGTVFPSDEDCLTINVIKPTSATANSKLPVVVWIFGGGFELGSPEMYDGTTIVQRSIAMGEPVIYVSMNYRLSAFGFLGGAEVRAAGVGNLGLQDQRQALRWVQQYIGKFGGDPTKVTIWGESAGAISAALHMVANNGDNEGLFRAAFMESGSPIPVGPIENGQKCMLILLPEVAFHQQTFPQDYDAIVEQVGCSSASDTLECLRTVPYASLKAAQDASPFIFAYQSLVLAWLPREDGTFLTDAPQALVQQGKVANVPFITGDCDDEGTLFSLSTLNVTTDAEFIEYITSIWLPEATTAMATTMQEVYPSDISDGSPFDTSILNAITPQFKRLAAFQGDAVFQAPRRFFQQSRSGKQNQWAFLSKRLKYVPVLGSFHFTDILNIYFDGELTDYLINFATKLNPNGNTVPNWPAYTTEAPNMMTFLDGLFPTTITQDTYRAEAMAFLTNVTLQFPI